MANNNINHENHSLLINTINGQYIIEHEDILMIKANWNYADVHFRDKEGFYDVSMHLGLLKTLENQLPPHFYKPHRSNIVNLYFVRGVKKENGKLKGVFIEILRSEKIKAKDKDWSFKISKDKHEELINRRRGLK